MSTRAHVYVLACLLIVTSAVLVTYKSVLLGIPILPGEYQTVWTIEAKVEFQAEDRPVKVSLALPKSQSNMQVLDEIFSSSGYGFIFDHVDGNERAIWSKRRAFGKQALYYKLDVYRLANSSNQSTPDFSTKLKKPEWSGSRQASLREAAASITAQSWQVSSDSESFVIQLLTLFNSPNNKDSRLIRQALRDRTRAQMASELLAMAGIPVHMLRGIFLEDDRSRVAPEELLEIYTGERWLVVNPKTSEIGLPANFLIWQRGDKSLLDVEGGRASRVCFSILANDVPAREAAIKQIGDETAAWVDYSIYSLPIEQQSIFKSILLMPVGALIVILLRVVVGVRTAGTFMPVLLAVAFIETKLFNGVVIFLLILTVGLWARSYLSRLDLLLTARIAAVVVLVVVIMSFLSIISYKFGFEQAFAVTFFPMIIIAWTIEHMSILWEDDGAVEVLIQTAGSLLVAIVCYLVMTNHFVEHGMFNFPELLLALLGVIIMLGNYTGYRVSEFLRFRHMPG
ncbi:MAG: inactive transglutaminase family protein [Spongiibacteraceae bacterium]|nr:inactive transglutaminase family protein [Spongiibacteraceae bacterium]